MELCFGQKVDPADGLVMPWITHGALDELAAMDLKDKIILQFGAGMGDAWLAKRCRHLICVERKPEWLGVAKSGCKLAGVSNVTYLLRECNEGSGMADFYINPFPEDKIDIIINDDAYRTEVCKLAMDYFQANGGGILICDNWWQDYVWKSPAAIEMLEPFRKNIHLQADHKDHEGDPWKTAIIYIEAKVVDKKKGRKPLVK